MTTKRTSKKGATERAAKRRRLSASVDGALLHAAERAVAGGAASTLSAWVDDAIRLKLELDARLSALAEFVATYEAEHGEITELEMRAAQRKARARALPARAAEGDVP